MSLAISGANAPGVAITTPAAAAFIAQLRTSSIAGSSRILDTVKISQAAQAVLMYQAGQSVSSIASSLGASASTVDSYLGIAAAIAVPTSVGHAAHTAPAKPAEPASTTKAPKMPAEA